MRPYNKAIYIISPDKRDRIGHCLDLFSIIMILFIVVITGIFGALPQREFGQLISLAFHKFKLIV